MITIKKSENNWEIKSAQGKILLNNDVFLGDFKIPGSGEFEVLGIQAEVLDGISTFYADDIVIVYIHKTKTHFTPEEIKHLGKSDIIFLPVAGTGTMTISEALKLLAEIEPTIVIPIHYQDVTELSKAEGIKIEEQKELKVNKNDLVSEERRVIVLQ